MKRQLLLFVAICHQITAIPVASSDVSLQYQLQRQQQQLSYEVISRPQNQPYSSADDHKGGAPEDRRFELEENGKYAHERRAGKGYPPVKFGATDADWSSTLGPEALPMDFTIYYTVAEVDKANTKAALFQDYQSQLSSQSQKLQAMISQTQKQIDNVRDTINNLLGSYKTALGGTTGSKRTYFPGVDMIGAGSSNSLVNPISKADGVSGLNAVEAIAAFSLLLSSIQNQQMQQYMTSLLSVQQCSKDLGMWRMAQVQALKDIGVYPNWHRRDVTSIEEDEGTTADSDDVTNHDRETPSSTTAPVPSGLLASESDWDMTLPLAMPIDLTLYISPSDADAATAKINQFKEYRSDVYARQASITNLQTTLNVKIQTLVRNYSNKWQDLSKLIRAGSGSADPNPDSDTADPSKDPSMAYSITLVQNYSDQIRELLAASSAAQRCASDLDTWVMAQYTTLQDAGVRMGWYGRDLAKEETAGGTTRRNLFTFKRDESGQTLNLVASESDWLTTLGPEMPVNFTIFTSVYDVQKATDQAQLFQSYQTDLSNMAASANAAITESQVSLNGVWQTVSSIFSGSDGNPSGIQLEPIQLPTGVLPGSATEPETPSTTPTTDSSTSQGSAALLAIAKAMNTLVGQRVKGYEQTLLSIQRCSQDLSTWLNAQAQAMQNIGVSPTWRKREKEESRRWCLWPFCSDKIQSMDEGIIIRSASWRRDIDCTDDVERVQPWCGAGRQVSQYSV